MTIEHLASQSLIGRGDYNEAIIGQLGNLILVPDQLNNDLKDKPFKTKKRILLDNGIIFPPDMIKAEDWGKKEIIHRTQFLADLAYNEIWNL